MSHLKLFYRLMVRPLLHEPVRLALTILAVGLGVAVVLAIELAGNAATGSFHSSMETLAGDNDLEVVASGGVPESVLAPLSSQPFPVRISPRIEDFATVTSTKQTLPLIGLDLIAEGSRYISQGSANVSAQSSDASPAESLKRLQDPASIWVGSSLGKNPGDQLQLLINDRTLL
jgi:putative ABC transport system permease protein